MGPIVAVVNGIPIQIAPGTTDRRIPMTFLGQCCAEAYWLRDDQLRATGIGDFARSQLSGNLTSAVYRRTAWIVPIGHVVTAFAMGAAIGFMGSFGVAAALLAAGLNASVALMKVSVLVYSHPRECEVLQQQLPAFFRSYTWFRRNCPVLAGKMDSMFVAGFRAALGELPSGISDEDIANFVGRVLGGCVGAADPGFGVLLQVVAKTALIYSAIHLPVFVANAAANAGDQIGHAVAQSFREQRAAITPVEERAIGAELARAGRAGQQHMTELQSALTQIAPVANRLARDWARDT